jgi:hypothetical protein
MFVRPLLRDGVIVNARRSSAAGSLRVAIAVLHVRPGAGADHVAAREREPITTVGVRISN